MTDVAVSRDDLRNLELPPWIAEALTDTPIPHFNRFDVGCEPKGLHLVERPSGRYLVLGRTDSGSLGVSTRDGSVWWLQETLGAPDGFGASAYEQFINSDLPSYRQAVHAYEVARRAIGGPDAEALRANLAERDPASLDKSNEGVWGDVLLDWEAGL